MNLNRLYEILIQKSHFLIGTGLWKPEIRRIQSFGLGLGLAQQVLMRADHASQTDHFEIGGCQMLLIQVKQTVFDGHLIPVPVKVSAGQ